MVHCESGILIDPGRPDQIAASVVLLKRDQALCQKIASGGREAFEEVFEFSRGIEQIRQIYREVCPL
jgi:glycosyltransferase involved in cell wall biosynthesis